MGCEWLLMDALEIPHPWIRLRRRGGKTLGLYSHWMLLLLNHQHQHVPTLDRRTKQEPVRHFSSVLTAAQCFCLESVECSIIMKPWSPGARSPHPKMSFTPTVTRRPLNALASSSSSAALSPLFASFFFSFPTTLSLLMSCTRLLLWSKSRPPSKARGDLG